MSSDPLNDLHSTVRSGGQPVASASTNCSGLLFKEQLPSLVAIGLNYILYKITLHFCTRTSLDQKNRYIPETQPSMR